MAAILNSAILNFAILDWAILNKMNFSFIHSYSTWGWQPSSILPYWIQPSCTKKLHSFILTQLDDGSHLEICHVGFRHCHLGFKDTFTYSFWLRLIIAAILNSAMLDSHTAILDSDTLLSCLRFTQKHSHSHLTQTQTNSFSLNLMMAAI